MEPPPSCSPPGGGLATSAAGTCSRSRCPPPRAGRRSPLRAAPRPQRRPHARDHLTRAWLRPSPADPKGRGFPAPGPPPPRQPALPLVAADCPQVPRAAAGAAPPATDPPLSTPCAYVSRPGARPLLRALIFNPRSTHFCLPLARGSSSHWSVVPVHFLREFNTSWQEEDAASLGA